MSKYKGQRRTATGLMHAIAICLDCGWECHTRNAQGLAAQHTDRTGHYVTVESHLTIAYYVGDRETAFERASEAFIERDKENP